MHFCVQPEPSHASAQPTSCISARNLPPLTFARNQLPAFLRAGCPAHRARSLPPEFLCTACPRTFARSLPPAFLRALSPLTRLRAACLLHSCVQPISCISARGLHRARLRAAYLLHFGAHPAPRIEILFTYLLTNVSSLLGNLINRRNSNDRRSTRRAQFLTLSI